MSDKLFYDTNMLVYAYDETEGVKRRAAEVMIARVFSGEAQGVISNQILAELFFALTVKMKRPMEGATAARIVRQYATSDKWTRIDYTSATVTRAIFISTHTKAHFWDALIAETMKENEITKLVTENTKDFERMPGITIVNPFLK